MPYGECGRNFWDINLVLLYIYYFTVSYNNQKLRLRWTKDGVTLNPELKLLQYNVGQPLELMETTGYMVEREGMALAAYEEELHVSNYSSNPCSETNYYVFV
jgi:hypothetical protein